LRWLALICARNSLPLAEQWAGTRDPGMEVEAQRRHGLDAVEVEHFAAGQRGDVAAFADFLDQFAQHGMARAMHCVVEQQVLGQPAQAQAGAVVAAVAFPLQHAGRFELLQHAMHGRLGQAGFIHQPLQVEKLVAPGNHFEQGEQAQRRRIAVDARRFRQFWGQILGSWCAHHSEFHSPVSGQNMFHFYIDFCFYFWRDLKSCLILNTGTPGIDPHRGEQTAMSKPDNRKVPEGPTRMTPSEAFVETMVANGVTDMFGIMGSAFMDAMDIFAPAGIRLIPVVHEQGAGHMADGYARVSGRHGVVIGQNGPGISNCVTAIAAAYWAHSPVVIVTPETGTMGMGLGGFQEANQLPMFEEFTKYQGHVNNPKRMAEYTGRCFDRAMSEMGPTQLNIPRDYFYGDITCEIPKPFRLDRGPGGEQTLNEAAELLAKAKFPVIISGGGVVMADGVEECKALAERLGAPVVNSYLHNDSFPASHPLWCGPLGYQGSKAAMKLMAQADVVVALGSRLGPFGTLPQHGMDYWPKDAKIIQIDADNTMLGLVKKISVGICGDAKAAAIALTQAPGQPHAGLRRHQGRARGEDQGRKGRVGKGARRLDPRARPIQPGHDRRERQGKDLQRRQLPAPAPGAARTGKGHAARRHGFNRHRQHQLGGQQLPALRKAAQHVRRDELRQLRLRLPHHDRRQGGGAAPAGDLVCRRRRLGHEPDGNHDLRAPQHPGDRRRLPQPPVGRGEEEPGGFLQPPLRRRRTRQPVLRRHRPRHGRRGHHGGQAGRRRPRAEEGHRPADEPRQDLHPRDHVHPRTGRSVSEGMRCRSR
jgi:hypothetical protein